MFELLKLGESHWESVLAMALRRDDFSVTWSWGGGQE